VALLDAADVSEASLGAQPSHPVDGIQDGEDPNSTTYIPLRSVNAVAAHIPFVEDAREKVTGEMQAMVLMGLTTLVRLPFPL
jgi:conserved oligomeric Golgi complex subunit 5